MKIAKLVAFCSALITTGCSLAPSDAVIEALSKDQATSCTKIHVVYGIGNGQITVYRANPTNPGTINVKCDDSGMTISNSSQGAPIIVSPPPGGTVVIPAPPK